MALRLRRGTDAERLTITPVEGELIYTTDLQELWIGDGVTAGGNKISGTIPQFLDDLTNVDAASPQIGQVLKWDGDNWVASDDEDTGVVEGASYKINILGPDSVTIVDSDTATFAGNFVGDGSGLTNLPIAADGSGIVEGSNYRINIVDDSSTVMLNTSTSTFTGNFVGDGSGLTNLPFSANGDGIVEGSNYRINIISDDSTVIVDTSTSTFNGNFIGDGNGITNILGSNVDIGIFQLNDVLDAETPEEGDVLIFDGTFFTPQKIRQIEGFDNTIIVDGITNTFTGTFNGSFAGDGSAITGILGSNVDLNSVSVFDLGDVFSIGDLDEGDLLVWDGFNFVNRTVDETVNFDDLEAVNISIIGDDSTILVDAETSTLRGNLENNFISTSNLEVKSDITNDIFLNFKSVTNGTLGPAILSKTSRLDSNNDDQIVNQNDTLLNIISDGFDGVDFSSSAIIRLGVDKSVNISEGIIPGKIAFLTTDEFGDFSLNNFLIFNHRGYLGVGTDEPTKKLDVRGDAVINGNFNSTGFVQFGSLTDTERNSLTAQNGMVIYNLTSNRFQGFQNNTWINLDDGSVA